MGMPERKRGVLIEISRPSHAGLQQVQEKLSAEKDRQVTLSETIEILIERAGMLESS